MAFVELAGVTGNAGVNRAQARLFAIKPLIDGLGQIYTHIAAGHITDPEVVAVLTTIADNHRAAIADYLTNLSAPGSATPIDRPVAEQRRALVKAAQGILEHLQRALPALSAVAVSDEDGKAVVSFTAKQKNAVSADIDRAVSKLAVIVT